MYTQTYMQLDMAYCSKGRSHLDHWLLVGWTYIYPIRAKLLHELMHWNSSLYQISRDPRYYEMLHHTYTFTQNFTINADTDFNPCYIITIFHVKANLFIILISPVNIDFSILSSCFTLTSPRNSGIQLRASIQKLLKSSFQDSLF